MPDIWSYIDALMLSLVFQYLLEGITTLGIVVSRFLPD